MQKCYYVSVICFIIKKDKEIKNSKIVQRSFIP